MEAIRQSAADRLREQIEITARPESWPNIGPTLVGLIAADLPAILWCRHYGALRKDASDGQIAGLEAVAQLAQKVILDTDGMDTNDAVGRYCALAEAEPRGG